MSKAWAVCKRELSAYFTTPVGWVILMGYALITGVGFTISFLFYAQMTASPMDYGLPAIPDFEEAFFSPYMVYCGTVILFLGPLITMRLLAEERNRGTEELLFTQPLRDRDIVLGKFGAAIGMLVLIVAIVIIQVLIVRQHVAVEPAVLIFGIVAVFLLGASILSLGLFVSACCRNQITAAIITFGALFLLFALGNVAPELDEASPVPATWPEALRNVLDQGYAWGYAAVNAIPLEPHASRMAQGVLLVSDATYFLLFISFFLFLSFRAVERRRWNA